MCITRLEALPDDWRCCEGLVFSDAQFTFLGIGIMVVVLKHKGATHLLMTMFLAQLH